MSKTEEKKVVEQLEGISPETANPVDDALKKAEEILAAATKTAEEIIAKAESAGSSVSSGDNAKVPYDKRPEVLAEIKRGEENVKLYLFEDNDRYKDDVYASIGGNNILIKRGIDVSVPRKYVAVISQAQKQNKAAMTFIGSIAGKNIEIK